MIDALAKEITDGGPAEVRIRGVMYLLAYPMHNVIVYKHQTGDSLFAAANWLKVDLEEDPERWLACLWAGLHQEQSDHSWKAPVTLAELGGLVDFSNASQITRAMVQALTSYFPKRKDSASPNATAPAEESRPAQSEPTATAPTSSSSTPVPNADSVLAGPNS
jgi:hypothetical protein